MSEVERKNKKRTRDSQKLSKKSKRQKTDHKDKKDKKDKKVKIDKKNHKKEKAEQEDHAPQAQEKDKKVKRAKKDKKVEEEKSVPEVQENGRQKQTQTSETRYHPRRVRVKNVHFKLTDDEIYEAFSDCGNGLFAGTVVLLFADEASVEKALAHNGETLGQREIRVERSRNEFVQRPLSPKPEGCKTVFIGNCGYAVTDDELSQRWSAFGKIEKIDWLNKYGKFIGCGFVTFMDSSATDKVIAWSRTEDGGFLGGRQVRIDYHDPNKKA